MMKITEEEQWIRAGRILGAQESLLKTMQSERAYQRALNNWRQYQHWKATRNPIRAQLEAKSGYDTKHASHLVRLMRMGGEILTQGKCNIWRGSIDAQELCAIRQGAWSYEQLIEWTDKTQKKLDHIFKNKECKLPLKPDIKAINELSIRLHQMWIEK